LLSSINAWSDPKGADNPSFFCPGTPRNSRLVYRLYATPISGGHASNLTGKEASPMALQELVPPARAVSGIPTALPAPTRREANAMSNTVLLSIPDAEFSILRPHLEPVALPRYQILYEQAGKIEHCYFLNDGMISLVVITSDGRSVEVGICGRQEVVGASLTFGVNYSAM